MTIVECTSTANGWNTVTVTVTVDALSSATGTLCRWRVTYRTRAIRCCGQLVVTGDGEHLPFWIDGSFADVKPHPRQCTTCGSLYGCHYTATEV